MTKRALFFIFLAACSGGGASSVQRSDGSIPGVVASSPPSAGAPMTEAKEPREGRVHFEGMVVPTKGGFMVHGIVIEDDTLPKALTAEQPKDVQRDDWFLGAVVLIDADLQKIANTSPGSDGVMEQTRSGTWFQVRQMYSATIVKPAVIIEGTLSRSKGFFTLGGHLIDRKDIDWALAGSGGAHEGDRVRLYGQPRTVHCEPNAQCLIQGSLPMFDVGRAERLP